MLVHVRTHAKEKPHQCRLCEKGFSRAENLKIDIRPHSGEKPYSEESDYIKHREHIKPSARKSFTRISSNSIRRPSYAQDSFCLTMEEMCHIKGNDIDSYWLTDEVDGPLHR
ncbi:hypothetical protein GQX74_015716 [Glossina fuscipes]|nr:hypothetical protein GQX74_015716 [Glossina fuscipes]